jgi:hypothetical protein
LLVESVWHLDDAAAAEVGIQRKEGHGAREDRLAIGVPHRDDGGVAVAQQVHLAAADGERRIHLDGPGSPVASRLAHADVRFVIGRVPPAGGGIELVAALELIEPERVRIEGCLGEEPPGVDGVVSRPHVRERLALHDHPLPGVAESAADADGDQHSDERAVEHQVARLAQVAALGGDRSVVPLDSIALPTQQLRRLVEGDPGIRPGLLRDEPDKALQARGCLRRPGAQCIEMVLRPRHDAADQRDEEQQVDRREPRRAEGAEQADRVEDAEQLRIALLELDHAVRIRRGLRHERPRHGGEGEQQEQQQRRPHARELPPEEAQVAEWTELRLRELAGLDLGVDVIRGAFQFHRSPSRGST